jgi:hypothetical protein
MEEVTPLWCLVYSSNLLIYLMVGTAKTEFGEVQGEPYLILALLMEIRVPEPSTLLVSCDFSVSFRKYQR